MTENHKQTPPKHHEVEQGRDLMTEDELIDYLRIPEVSKAKDYHNTVDNLKRMHDLPRIHICGQPLYPREAIQDWVRTKTINGRK